MAVETKETAEMEGTAPTRRASRRLWVVLVLLAGLIGVGGYVAGKVPGRAQSAAPPTAPRAIRVVVTPAHAGDLPVYLSGIGSVTPLLSDYNDLIFGLGGGVDLGPWTIDVAGGMGIFDDRKIEAGEARALPGRYEAGGPVAFWQLTRRF